MREHPIITEINERIARFLSVKFPLTANEYKSMNKQLEDFIFW